MMLISGSQHLTIFLFDVYSEDKHNYLATMFVVLKNTDVIFWAAAKFLKPFYFFCFQLPWWQTLTSNRRLMELSSRTQEACAMQFIAVMTNLKYGFISQTSYCCQWRTTQDFYYFFFSMRGVWSVQNHLKRSPSSCRISESIQLHALTQPFLHNCLTMPILYGKKAENLTSLSS